MRTGPDVLLGIAAVLGIAAGVLGLVAHVWGVAVLGLLVVVMALVVRGVSGSRFGRRVR